MRTESTKRFRYPFQQQITVAINDYLIGQFRPVSRAAVFRRLRRIGMAGVVLFSIWLIAFVLVRAWDASYGDVPESYWYQEPTEQSTGLVVVVHGWTKGPNDMEQVANVVKKKPEYKNHAIYLWAYDSAIFSNGDPEGFAQDLALKLKELHKQVPGEIVLMGHSLGGLLVRRAYLTGLDNKEPWSNNVERIVLLAAPNRGTEATSRSRWLWLQDTFVKSLRAGALIRSTYRGAPFVVNLRVDWIRRFQTMDNPPLVAQIVGRKDHVVSSSDSIDVLQFPNSVTYELNNSTHASVINAAESGAYIREVLEKKRSVRPQTDTAPDESVFKLLIVHGIRDYGGRFDEIEDAVKSRALQRGLNLEASSPRYKYFSALQFVNPVSRQHKVYEFADMYAEMLATPPVNAPIYFVGHSFGTYLMGKSTQVYDAVEFERVYLAGSVLPEGFFAKQGILGGRIQYVRNDIATKDWPVGILCSGIAGLGLAEDIGTGGFNGFTRIVEEDRYEEIRYFDGGHGKALEQTNRSNIADWLLQDSGISFELAEVDMLLKEAKVVTGDRSYLWGFASRAAPALFLVFLGLIAYLLVIGGRPLFALSETLLIMWLLHII